MKKDGPGAGRINLAGRINVAGRINKVGAGNVVDNVNEVSPEGDEFVRDMDAEVRAVERDARQGNITLVQGLNRLDSILDRLRRKR